MAESSVQGVSTVLRDLIVWMDDDLDSRVADTYKGQPLAQDWARVAKVAEETGEVIDALIGATGQNPRKGRYGGFDDVLTELADVALTGLYAIQHFTKNGDRTIDLLMDRACYHRARREEQFFLDSLSDEERAAWARRVVGAVPDESEPPS